MQCIEQDPVTADDALLYMKQSHLTPRQNAAPAPRVNGRKPLRVSKKTQNAKHQNS